MRREMNLYLSTSILTVLALSLLTPATAIAQRPVNVHATCPTDLATGTLVIVVNPWIIDVDQDDSIKWNLTTNNSANNKIRVEKKEDGDWPYKKPYYEGTGSTTADDMKENQQGTDSRYNIIVYCGASEPILIDPRIKVGG